MKSEPGLEDRKREEEEHDHVQCEDAIVDLPVMKLIIRFNLNYF